MSEPIFMRLPLHLVGMILMQLDDMQTLGSAILSHSLLYASYQDFGVHKVTLSVLENQIPRDVMPYAIMAFRAQNVDHTNEEACRRVLRSRRCRRQGLRPLEWFLKHGLDAEKDAVPTFAVALRKTHLVVQHFCDRFIQRTLPLAQEFLGKDLTCSHPSLITASDKEIYRVQKALYRFQVFCDLRNRYRSDPYSENVRDNYTSPLQVILRDCSPWVNEQLACIYDFLENVLSHSFDRVAAHDVEWGAQSADWSSPGKQNKNKQAFLSFGLHFLYELDKAPDFQQQQRILKDKGLCATSSGLANHFAGDRPDQGLCLCCSPGKYPLRYENHWTAQEIKILLTGDSRDGIDGIATDPFEIWWYAHKHNFANQFEYQIENSHLRRYGYVMWDLPRWGDSRASSRKRIRKAQSEARLEVAVTRNRIESMQRSWREMAEIFKAGGRGYWRQGDLSQIVWMGGNSEKDQFEMHNYACSDEDDIWSMGNEERTTAL